MIEETRLVPGKTTARDLETRADLHGRAFCRLQSETRRIPLCWYARPRWAGAGLGIHGY